MILACDIGNTNMVFGAFRGEEQAFQIRLRSDPMKTVDEYAGSLLYLFDQHGVKPRDFTGCVVGSVVPQLQFTICRFALKYLRLDALVVGAGVKTGVPVRVDNPRETGADRIANAAGALYAAGAPCVVMDFGTATTFDVVNRAGEYCGGVILPGVKLMAGVLHSNTAKLPEIEIEKPSSAVGRNTVASMKSGLYYGYSSMLNGILEKVLKEEFGGAEGVSLFATGGLSALFLEEINYPVRYEPSLTLTGLRLIYEKNRR